MGIGVLGIRFCGVRYKGYLMWQLNNSKIEQINNGWVLGYYGIWVKCYEG